MVSWADAALRRHDVGNQPTMAQNEQQRKTIGEKKETVHDVINRAFEGIEEFDRRNSPAVKDFLRGMEVEPDALLAADSHGEIDDPFVYIRVFDAPDFDSVAVVMSFLNVPARVFVGGGAEVLPALSEMEDHDYCWIIEGNEIAKEYIK